MKLVVEIGTFWSEILALMSDKVCGTKIDAFDWDLNVQMKKLCLFRKKLKVFGRINETFYGNFNFYEYIFFSENRKRRANAPWPLGYATGRVNFFSLFKTVFLNLIDAILGSY